MRENFFSAFFQEIVAVQLQQQQQKLRKAIIAYFFFKEYWNNRFCVISQLQIKNLFKYLLSKAFWQFAANLRHKDRKTKSLKFVYKKSEGLVFPQTAWLCPKNDVGSNCYMWFFFFFKAYFQMYVGWCHRFLNPSYFGVAGEQNALQRLCILLNHLQITWNESVVSFTLQQFC